MKQLDNGLNILEFDDLMNISNLKGKLYLYQVDSESHESCIRVQLDKVSLSIDREESNQLAITLSISNRSNKWELKYQRGSEYSVIGTDEYWVHQYLTHDHIKNQDQSYIYIELNYLSLVGNLLYKEIVKVPRSSFRKYEDGYIIKLDRKYYFIDSNLMHKRGNKIIKYKIIYG